MTIASSLPFRVPLERAAVHPGDTYGEIQVCGVPFYVARKTKGRRQHVVGKCKCGQHILVLCDSLLAGHIKTCGCGKRKHGLSRSRLYKVWMGMIGRCESIKSDGYEHYGARGISVCSQWCSDFVEFYSWAIANGYSDGLQIERIDNDGDYEPSNCCFVTRTEQMNNTRRTAFVTAFGETKSIAQWSRDSRCVVPVFTLRARIKSGVAPESAITTTAREYSKPIEELTAFGETKAVSEWASDSRCVVSEDSLRARILQLGWTHERAISQPVSDSQKRALATREKRRRQRLARAKATPKKPKGESK